MFLPTTRQELDRLGWDTADIIIVSGDTYIDCPYDGAAIVGKALTAAGYRSAIISQPDLSAPSDIARLGEPNIFWGVTSGCVDSMVANYTASKKKRRSDDLTPGGVNNRRPDRAVIQYTNLIKRYFKSNKPVVLGGIEASLRRLAHYDYWSDRIRGSILLDSKADVLVYGEGERTAVELAEKIKSKDNYYNIRGICYISNLRKQGCIGLPSLEQVRADKEKFIEMFHEFYKNNDPLNAKSLQQQHGMRWVIQNPPNHYLSQEELDRTHEQDFEQDAHPYYKNQGRIKALDTVRFSINSHRGCFGDCNFCSIAVHQGRTVRSRSTESILTEAKSFTNKKGFKGIIYDVGGPTANMYGMSCPIQLRKGSCQKKSCTYPAICNKMDIDHGAMIDLYERLLKIDSVKKVFIASGLRHDLVLADRQHGTIYLEKLVRQHVSGQLKIAPEHIEAKTLDLMRKPGKECLMQFIDKFDKMNKKFGKQQFLTFYFIVSHPGSDQKDTVELKKFIDKVIITVPEQVQIFTPTPSTYSTLMYYCEIDPFTGKKIFVEKSLKKASHQKNLLQQKNKSAHDCGSVTFYTFMCHTRRL